MRIDLGILMAWTLATILGCGAKMGSSPGDEVHLFSPLLQNLRAVQSSFVPASVTTSKTLPCSTVADFGTCQTRRALVELQNSQRIFVDLISAVENAGLNLGNPADNTQGTSSRFSWSKTSSSQWSYLAKNNSGVSVLSITQSGTVTTILWDQRAADVAQAKALALVLDYGQTDAWSLRLFRMAFACDSSRPDAPSHAEIRMTRSGSLAVAKSLLIIPRWPSPGQSVSCSSATTNSVALYLDLVANTQVGKGALYISPSSLSDFSQPLNYELSDFCSNFPSLCGDGATRPSISQVNLFTSPWCQVTPQSVPQWNSTCLSFSSVVAATAFMDTSNWIAPATFSQQTIVLPTQL